MCGIHGLIFTPNNNFTQKTVKKCYTTLALLSESRGKDSSGFATRIPNKKTIEVIKGDIPISDLIKNNSLKVRLEQSLLEYKKGYTFSVLGHARLVTNGSQLLEYNNQPVIKNDIIAIHNGIIVNEDKLWAENLTLKREYEIDTEIIPALISKDYLTTNNLVKSCCNSFNKLEGTFSVALMFSNIGKSIVATNNGSLYYITDNKSFFIYASESNYLEILKKKLGSSIFPNSITIEQLMPNSGIEIDLDDFKVRHFSFSEQNFKDEIICKTTFQIEKDIIKNTKIGKEIVIDPSIYINRNLEKNYYSLLEDNTASIKRLKRCSKCLLTETFPFIHFDDNGICNYCHNYKPKIYGNSFDDLLKLVEPYRKKNQLPDCIVPFSGGRDSTYCLHIIKHELKLKPIAFTYDWGMVTDLARRNIARVCGKLGVENIIVSADINWKRDNIRKNIEAWLKYPHLGMIPLFMAGDKYFFYHTNKLKKQTGIDLNIWGINHLENTDFKVGFAGIEPKFDKKRIYSLSVINQLKLFGFVGNNILHSPSYLNQSVFDSLGSFATRYISPKKDYYHLFDYHKWDENEINKLIFDEYKWETAIDTKSTWRIGDGTASFYNYIYMTVAGFTENDTFRSNQIREGMITREEALMLIEDENKPRYETLRWYLEILKLDFSNVIKIVNNIKKMYPIEK